MKREKGLYSLIRKLQKPFMCAIIILLIFTQVFADGGNNSTSPGTPGHKPLNFISITLEDGSRIYTPEGIITEPKFVITFDKNVVNMLFWENNSKCFTLFTDINESIPIYVTKIDDTVDFSQRQKIFVQPVNPLKQGAVYILKISPDLRAKNGNSTLGGTTSEKGLAITFKTKGEAAAQAVKVEQNTAPVVKEQKNINQSKPVKNPSKEAKPLISGEKTVSKPSNPPKTESAKEVAPVNTPSNELPVKSETQAEAKPISRNQWMLIGVILLVLFWILIEIWIKRKSVKNKQ